MKNFLFIFLCVFFIFNVVITLALCKAAGKDKDRYNECNEYDKFKKDADKIS